MKLLYPAWLAFAVCNLSAKEKWTAEHDKLAKKILTKLESHLELYGLSNDNITKPNNNESNGNYLTPIIHAKSKTQ